MALSLDKKTELVTRLTLEKNIRPDLKMEVKVISDVSGSMQNLYRDGTVNDVLVSMLAFAMRFDPNKTVESYIFASDAIKTDDITQKNYEKYVDSNIMNRRWNALWTGTVYSRALALLDKPTKQETGGFFKKLFSKPEEVVAKTSEFKSWVMFITDGETSSSDEDDTIAQIEALGSTTYIQFVGVGTQIDDSFLKRVSRKFDNCGYVHVPNISKMTEEDLYSAIITDELKEFLG